jgi:hypothetical protein
MQRQWTGTRKKRRRDCGGVRTPALRGRTQRLTADTHTQRETKEPAARSNAVVVEPGTRRQQVAAPLAAECVCNEGGQLTPGPPASACASALGRRPGRPPRPDCCHSCCKQAKARDQSTHRHTDRHTQRGVNPPPQNKNETGVSRNRALFSLSLYSGKKRRGGKRWRSNPRPQGPNAAPYGRHTQRERDKGAGCQEQCSGGGRGHGDNK